MKNNHYTTSGKIAFFGLAVFALPLLFGVRGSAAAVPNHFSSGTTISSSDVNENFSYLSEKQNRSGKLVGPGLYEVHTRVLWDVGWMRNEAELENGNFSYGEQPRNLIYGGGRAIFLSPLRGYGIPEVQAGATRKVRLYVFYGEQLDYNGEPTIRIANYQGGDFVDFSLPKIGGHYADMGANWTDYATYADYKDIGHANISIGYDNCTNCSQFRLYYGVLYRIEAYFYDEFAD